MADAISVVLVDDHSVVRLGLKAYFDTLVDIRVVGEAASEARRSSWSKTWLRMWY